MQVLNVINTLKVILITKLSGGIYLRLFYFVCAGIIKGSLYNKVYYRGGESMSIIELELNDKNFPDEAGLNLWIGGAGTDVKSVEICIVGILHMQGESLSCTLSEQDAIRLAGAILDSVKIV